MGRTDDRREGEKQRKKRTGSKRDRHAGNNTEVRLSHSRVYICALMHSPPPTLMVSVSVSPDLILHNSPILPAIYPLSTSEKCAIYGFRVYPGSGSEEDLHTPTPSSFIPANF
jgi:hypothetical protein